MPTLKAPADKLPLTARKNLRDEWESKRPEYEAKILESLSEAWTIDLNANLIYVYADETYKSRLGSVIQWYMDPFIDNLKKFVDKFGEDGKRELNSICSKHQLSFGPQVTTKFSYGGLVVENGVLHLVFEENSFATNVGDVSKDIAQALKDAPPPPGASAFNLVARNAVSSDYDPKVEEVRSAIAELVNMPNLRLNPNFEHNSKELAKLGSQMEDFDKRIGWLTLAYFQGLQYVLKQNKFKDDDMLQEGFQEGVEKGEVCVQIVDKLEGKGSSSNEAIVKGGVLYIQTTPENWGVNVDDATQRLMDIL